MVFDKITAERIVEAAMTFFSHESQSYGFTLRATPEAVEALKQSDSPFAGFIITHIDPENASANYESWLSMTLDDYPGGETMSMDEVHDRLEARMRFREETLNKLKNLMTPEEITVLGVRLHDQ